MNVERILELADLIEKLPHTTVEAESGFTMDNWRHDCGTPACIAGWACALALGRQTGIPLDASGIARNYLGLDYKDAEDLFEPDLRTEKEDRAAVTDTWADITPRHAASTLRHLAQTGEVNWRAAPYANGTPAGRAALEERE